MTSRLTLRLLLVRFTSCPRHRPAARGERAEARRSCVVAAAFMLLLLGCGRSTPPSPTSPSQPGAAPATREGVFSKAQLIQDARQLADILESSHPDAYINGGGRIAFHRRLHRVLNAIPDEGMTKDEFFRYCPKKVIVLCDAGTLNAGFSEASEGDDIFTSRKTPAENALPSPPRNRARKVPVCQLTNLVIYSAPFRPARRASALTSSPCLH